MRRLIILALSLLLASSLGLGSVVHAAESANCVDLPIAVKWIGTDAGSSGEQSPDDPDKRCLRCQAGCHGHHVATSTTAELVVPFTKFRSAPATWTPNHRTMIEPNPALRPPQA